MMLRTTFRTPIRPQLTFHPSLAALAVIVWFVPACPGQSPDGEPAAYVPPSAVAAARVQPGEILASEAADWLPIEVAQAWGEANLGVGPQDVIGIKLVLGLPVGPGLPPIGAVVRLEKDFDPADIREPWLLDPPTEQFEGQTVYRLGDPTQPLLLHAVDARTVLVATPPMLPMMLRSASGAGPLVRLLQDQPIGSDHVQLLASVETVRPMLAPLAAQAAERLPPELSDLSRVPELLQAVVVSLQVEGVTGQVRAELVCEDGGQAAELEQILLTAIDFGRASFIAQATAEVEGTDKIAEAQRAYAERIATKVSELLTPRREDRKLIVDAESGMSVASTGMLVGLLLPAVQAAREAARRTQAANHLKQIGLALHNYHAVHGHFPPPAITDEDGRPLLSWRVAILPYLEARDLHNRFRLDEPWDSDHNRRLINQMPELFSDASVPVPPGQTVFQMVTGEAIGLQPQGPTRLAELTDGTSNTVLVVETDQAEAVPWTAPREVDIDLDAPLAKMGHSHAGGFQVLFADGSVRFISHSVDPQIFRALLTRAGGERLGDF